MGKDSKIFNGKKLNFGNVNKREEELVNDFSKFRNLSKNLVDIVREENEKPSENNIVEEHVYSKPVFPMYCPNCGAGIANIRKYCSSCNHEIDYSRENINPEFLQDEKNNMFFYPDTKEAYAYNFANEMIKLYYSSNEKSTQMKVADIVLRMITDTNKIEYNIGTINVMKRFYDELNVTPDNPHLNENLTPKFADKVLKFSETLIIDYNNYLKEKSIGDRNYEEIQAFLQRNIADKKLFDKSKKVND